MSQKNNPKICGWIYVQKFDAWVTQCGRIFDGLTSGATPNDSGFIFCPFCGGVIVERVDVEKENQQ